MGNRKTRKFVNNPADNNGGKVNPVFKRSSKARMKKV